MAKREPRKLGNETVIAAAIRPFDRPCSQLAEALETNGDPRFPFRAVQVAPAALNSAAADPKPSPLPTVTLDLTSQKVSRSLPGRPAPGNRRATLIAGH